MSVAQALIAFTAAAALLTITPGLDTALVLRTAAVEGPRRAMLAGAGICLGCLAWGLMTAVGLGALLAASYFAYNVLRLIGACYLIVLGVRMFFRRRLSPVAAGARTEAASNESASAWFGRGFLTNILNPKVGVFYVTFLPQFVPQGVRVTPFTMLLATIHVAEGMLWFSVLVLATSGLSRWLARSAVATTLDRITGAILVGFGLKLVAEKAR